MNPEINTSRVSTMAALVSVGAVSFLALGAVFLLVKDTGTQVATVIEAATSTPARSSPFDTLPLEARAAYVVDLVTGEVLLSRNAELQLPLASLTKLMSALIVSAALADTDTISITATSLEADGDSGLRVGERFTMRDLLSLALISSSNDATVALGEAALAKSGSAGTLSDLMNTKARNLHLVQTYFVNETGLDPSPSVSGAYGSAKDVASLLSFLITNHADLLEPTTKAQVMVLGYDATVAVTHTAKNTNVALPNIPGLIASKTGFTDLAGGNLAIGFDVGLAHPLVAVVLGSSEEGRFTDMLKIVSTANEHFSK